MASTNKQAAKPAHRRLKDKPLAKLTDSTSPVVNTVASAAAAFFSSDLSHAAEGALRLREAYFNDIAIHVNARNRHVMEIMCAGSLTHEMYKACLDLYISHYGDSEALRKLVRDVAYASLRNIFGYGSNACTFYRRAWERFSGNALAIKYLSVTDMRILTSRRRSDASVAAVIALRQSKPKCSKNEVLAIIQKTEADFALVLAEHIGDDATGSSNAFNEPYRFVESSITSNERITP